MEPQNDITTIVLTPWEEIIDVLHCFSHEGSDCFLTFRNHERICIPLKDQEMADQLEKAVGKTVSVLRTDIPDHEYFHLIHDELHEDSKKTTKETSIKNTKESTDGTIIKEKVAPSGSTLKEISRDNTRQSSRHDQDTHEIQHLQCQTEQQKEREQSASCLLASEHAQNRQWSNGGCEIIAATIDGRKNLPIASQETDIRYLQLWEEVNGRLQSVSIENGLAKISFYDNVIVPITNPDKVSLKKLQKATGKIISVLCTDLPGKTYLIKIQRKKKTIACLTFFHKNGKERLDYYLSNIKNENNTNTNGLPIKDKASARLENKVDVDRGGG
jgi:hypothetical protein